MARIRILAWAFYNAKNPQMRKRKSVEEKKRSSNSISCFNIYYSYVYIIKLYTIFGILTSEARALLIPLSAASYSHIYEKNALLFLLLGYFISNILLDNKSSTAASCGITAYVGV